MVLQAFIFMVSRLDVLLLAGLFPGSASRDILRRLQKKSVAYDSLYKLLKKLESENLVRKQDSAYFLADNSKARRLFWLVNFCFANSIDYNIVVSGKTAEFVRMGLERGAIRGLPFDAKTVRKIVSVLSKKGFAVVESRKPFACRIVYSIFLERLVEFFSKKPKVLHKSLPDILDKGTVDGQLEKEFSAYRKLAKRRLEFDEIEFIHSSLSLEGNTLTLPETEKVIEQNVPPASKPFKDTQEVLDYKKALDDFVFSGGELALESILEFHHTAMNSMPAGAGRIRRQNVQIKGNPEFRTPDWREVPSFLKEFFAKSNAFGQEKKLSTSRIVEQAAFLHSEFQRIHPFVDGNSRTARAIFIKVLLDKGFPLVKIPIGFFDQYMGLTKLSEKRDDPKFALLMKQIVLENLRSARKKIEYAE